MRFDDEERNTMAIEDEVTHPYQMEPLEEDRITEWMIELEIGNGVGRNLAVISHLRGTKAAATPSNKFMTVGTDGKLGLPNIALSGGKYLTVPLEKDEIPNTPEAALELADQLAVALLEIPGKASPSDCVKYVFHRGLTEATKHEKPFFQHNFRYRWVAN